MNKVRIGIVGVSGFGESHLKSIGWCAEQGLCELSAAVIRNPQKDAVKEQQLSVKGVRIYRGYEAMFQQERGRLDLIAIPCGHDQHEILAVRALKAGYNVMCEKPAAGTLAEALRMRETAAETGKILAIGYQNIYSPTIQAIKKYAVERKFGKLVSAKTYALWSRSSAYYKRNAWAGKLTFAGNTIYDSPMQNACAHFLQNMLYVAGPTHHESAEPVSVYMENYHAKEIESADTQFIRVHTATGAKLTFIVSHSCDGMEGPVTEFHFQRGRIIWSNQTRMEVQVKRGNGYDVVEKLENGSIPTHHLVFKNVCEAIQNGGTPLCTIDNAIQHVKCISNGFISSNGVCDVASKYTTKKAVAKESYNPDLDVTNEHNLVINGIEAAVKTMYAQEKSFYEMKLPWAKKSRIVVVAAEKKSAVKKIRGAQVKRTAVKKKKSTAPAARRRKHGGRKRR
ncbi:MAG: Gfo/Idh/MocA family oxidoreductase [Spirochaetes bacterium]|nr:Gfo/Idh/MocA family oxidoreductase [Spirochaetota bacterium]